ncbi:MAG: tetratricopeptide repeat protein, partial [Verrucomicrobiota bacterium]|nr:tetratricopeptide repeat protein [Verrucomicrobiota bacterium]
MAQPADPGGAEALANRLGQAIDDGDANAAFRLAELYRSGEGQLPVDLAKAVSLYKTAARLGNHPMAMNTLGLLYEQGWGVKASQALALQWYRKAARAGSAMALANLGKIHAQGSGVLQDYRLAVVELKKAAGDWVTVRVPASDLGVIQDSPFRFSAASLMPTGDETEIDWGYSRRVEWNEVPARKFVFDRQFDSAEVADITVADVRIDGNELLLELAVFGGVARKNLVHFIWFFDTDGRESGVSEFRLHDAPPLKPERLPHADRALQIVLPPGNTTVLPVYLLSGAKPAKLAEGRFFKGDNVAAQHDLGIIYAKGKKNPRDVGGDVKQNFRLASDWFFRAAAPRPNHADYASGHAGAQNNLGVLYSKGNLYRREDRRSDKKRFEPKPYEQAAL